MTGLIRPARASSSYIWLLILAQFGIFVAFITPLAISLAVRLAVLAPANEEYLGYITGSGSVVVMIITPIIGILSDRTRSRFGRRRPWVLGGMLVGVVSLFVMGAAPSVFLLGAGWVLAQIGWGTSLAQVTTSMADTLPEHQRGKVAGFVGFATQVAPVAGVIIAGYLVGDALLMFLIPGVVGVVFVLLFVLFSREQDSRMMTFAEKLTFGSALGKYIFNPAKYPDYSLVWVGRFLFYFGLTLNTTFTAFFFASRLDVGVDKVAGVLATLSFVGIAATTIGALGGGWLSDKLRRRRLFVLVASLIFAAGVIMEAVATDVPMLFAGSLVASVGIGAFSAVDQALLLDVLPERDTDAGRFMGIAGFATAIPQAVAPFLAPLILVIGATAAGEKNYTLLYWVAGAITVIGGFVVMRIRSVR
ncbi:MFS transporter [Microbacterium azadirachtae]|uniref:MFS transporter n=1 Tax=Microbacterium azadirachtae TaxID=582680 RepID=UPI001F2B4524|nr:MFS transporter [Microbacterium azadirachtae]